MHWLPWARCRAEGLRIGVLSDCTHELRDIWDDLPLSPLVDAVVLSITMGERKPHASLYLSVCQRLGIDPSEAIYIGDGGQQRANRGTTGRDERRPPGD